VDSEGKQARRSTMSDTHATLETITYEDEPGRVIRVRVEGPEGYERGAPLPYVLVVHGFKGFMHWGFFPEFSRRIARAGIVCVAFNGSGSGIGADLLNFTEEEAFARNTVTRELEDLDRVRALVRSGTLPGIDTERGAIVGHSRGGGTALLHAAEHGDYRAVVTWAAIDRVDRMDEAAKASWRATGSLPVPNSRTGQVLRLDVCVLEDWERNRARFDIPAACARLAAPTLVIHGADDEAVPVAAAETLFTALPAAGRKRLILADTGHTFGGVHPLETVPEPLERVFEATLGFLEERQS